MKTSYTRAFLIIAVTLNVQLQAGILFKNYCFITELIEQKTLHTTDRKILMDLKNKLRHNCNYIKEHEDLLEYYIELYAKHKAGKSSISFLLSRNDGKAQYKEEFVTIAPFVKGIMNKKRSRPCAPDPLHLFIYSSIGSEDFFTI